MDEQRLSAFARRHRQALGIGLPVVVAMLIFVLEGGVGAGWGNFLAAAVLASALWLGMKIVLYFLASVPRDIRER